MARLSTTGSLTTTGSVTLTKPLTNALAVFQISGTYGTVAFVFEGTFDGTNYVPLAAVRMDTGATVTGSVAPTDNTTRGWYVQCLGCDAVRLRTTAVGSGTVAVYAESDGYGPSGIATLAVQSTALLSSLANGTSAAAGSNQGTATALTNEYSSVTDSDGTKGVILPSTTRTTPYLVYNSVAAQNLKVYPPSGQTINGGSANAAITQAGKTLAILVFDGTSNWTAIYS